MTYIYSRQQDVVTHALLYIHLYRSAILPTFLPAKTSNELLVKWLKVRLNKTENKHCKKFIKELIHYGRGRDVALIDHLDWLNSSDSSSESANLDHFIQLAQSIERHFKMNFKILPCVSSHKQLESFDTSLFLITDDVGKHFAEPMNTLILPLNLLVDTNVIDENELMSQIAKTPFTATENAIVANSFKSIFLSN
ncbi:hypothetical protein JR728_003708 [Vibrio vulnificus]|nr:hypothetical protein [Vibrio vulnificus]